MRTKTNGGGTQARENGPAAAGASGLRSAVAARHGVPHGSRGETAYRRLRDAIREGQVKPGDRIMEIEAAQWLGVSRTPVRDAIRRLEAEGMLQHEPRNGLAVAESTGKR